MNEAWYVYAFTWANAEAASLGAGVDPPFPVELVSNRKVAALASRLDLARFNLAKLQEGTASLPWVSEVAVRHDEIVRETACRWPVLPLRLGTVFTSRSSLLARLGECEAKVASFLEQLGTRREWTVKVYLDESLANDETNAPEPCEAALAQGPAGTDAPGGAGTQYLVARRRRNDRRRETKAVAARLVGGVESDLGVLADAWRRLAPLSAAVTGRPEKMLWNGAFLLREAVQQTFQATCERLCESLGSQGLLLKATGPWPPYHFCPTLEP
jgi:hypothetical protein